MKPLYFCFTLFIGLATLQAQQIDYNIKNGFVANGYDVVSYFKNNPVKGNKKYTAKYEGAWFKFTSQENLTIFKLNSIKYIPQYGGYCAYAIGAKSEKVGINPKTFAIQNDRLYLFYNAWGTNTLNLWKKDVKVLQQNADKNWERIKLRN